MAAKEEKSTSLKSLIRSSQNGFNASYTSNRFYRFLFANVTANRPPDFYFLQNPHQIRIALVG